ncbi:hypothetical protein OIV83_004724 [Microbotryomycetes sp. JL201]|nr:hypothetical protein OIV83_004724 [Microbotryomycetes sp. JL201]
MRWSTLASAILVLAASVANAASPIIAQYYPAYSSQRPSQVPYDQMNVGYYFVTVTTNDGSIFSIPSDQSISDMQDFVSRARANGVRPVVAIGGWTGSRYFSSLTNTVAKRKAFAAKVAQFLARYNFDGVDWDWEYPGSQGIGCNQVSGWDASQFIQLLKETRAAIGSNKLQTAAMSINGLIGINGEPISDFGTFAQYLNYVNLMTYDIAGPWDKEKTGPTSPLRTCGSDASVEQAVNLFLSRGFPANKLLVGIPSYGVSWTTKSSTLSTRTFGSYSSKAYQAWTGVTPKGQPGDSNAESTDVCGQRTSGYSGQWTYKTLISSGLLSSDGARGLNGYVRYWDECTQTPFLWNSSKRHMINYDDARSAGAKAAYAKSKGLGGVMMFDTQGFDVRVYSSIKGKLGI